MKRLHTTFPTLTSLIPLVVLAGCGSSFVGHSTDIHSDDFGPMRVISQLQCPDHQGGLTRVRTAADGLSCDYAGPRGAEVTLKLVRVAADQKPEDVLPPIEAQLTGLMPQLNAKLSGADAGAEAHSGTASATSASWSDKDGPPTASGRTTAGMHVVTSGDNAHVNMPGIHIDANDKGAHLNLFGMHIDANDDGNHTGAARIKLNGQHEDVEIHAKGETAIVRTRAQGQGLHANLVLADGDPGSANGWRMVAYEAAGPQTGPVVVAIIKSRDRHGDTPMREAKALVRLNVAG